MIVKELIEKLTPFEDYEVIIYDMSYELPEDQIQLFIREIKKDEWTNGTVYILLEQ